MSDPIDYEALHNQVEIELQKQKRVMKVVFLGVNLLIFVLFAILTFAMVQNNPDLKAALDQVYIDDAPLIMLPFIGWGLALMFQFITLLTDLGIGDKQMRGQIIARELGTQMLQAGLTRSREKPKREPDQGSRMVLTDDGELAPVEPDLMDAVDEDEHDTRQPRVSRS